MLLIFLPFILYAAGMQMVLDSLPRVDSPDERSSTVSPQLRPDTHRRA